ncbi:chemotaxis protein CheB [Flaviaesturariibacter flavus]|uniref:protein-glutamate methylesterase n=1 Tax=Flaviaesturariibacter flavus TaxID=2502780 RepID=A0A4R1B3N4_9BACT|nr:chemotaxis protein CheB [Flaviaesturariibacter flavus]TCJ12674.1 chemotaxis protein CheB [Flaviaesturariibacter flavus]
MAQDGMILAIGGSAGSLEVLLQVFPLLRRGLPFPIVVITHRASQESVLAELLSSRTELPVREAEDKDVLQPGAIMVAPPGYHLLVEADGSLSLDCSEKIHYSRPSIDVTFETIADSYGSRAVGLLLSGANHDGVAGLGLIRAAGGGAWAQDPATAQVAFMPQGAVDRGFADRILKPGEMADAINALG